MTSATTARRAIGAAFRAVILGAPASGKGTVSSRIVKSFNVTHVSSGDILRRHIMQKTELGLEVSKYLSKGDLVPDETMIVLIGKEVESLDKKNWLLDGFPRTVAQAERLQQLYPVNIVINLVVPHDVILKRVEGRWVHLPSGRVYNIGFNEPKVSGKDDVTGEPLVQRPDDKREVVERRLNDYAKNTEPVIEYYRKTGILSDFHGSTTDEMWPSIKDYVAKFTS
ncbi:GTP:AMP phosphotransferase AK3, mitochondrial isoform X1 [Neodiprion virginianus]|uniref:GTP:AMP phosphotransferase AK3, mitochondrial n=1 Tax=Neodiprion fabricii TaxID=2872261 RepID=UPI001ED8C148|nr:GTP:AMP phosphotransferase AK3, mitochondrial [Neodiprion fabricii]XP_046623192.1 GTP:AMP phosphotransferase AK3, mitochondrial isoform X1 [Neodiprion virginianus]